MKSSIPVGLRFCERLAHGRGFTPLQVLLLNRLKLTPYHEQPTVFRRHLQLEQRPGFFYRDNRFSELFPYASTSYDL